MDGRLEFYVRESEGVSFVPNCSYTDKVRNVSNAVIQTSGFVREYLEAVERLPDFEVEGLKNKYRLIA